MAIRSQLSLFVPADIGAAIEAVRRVLDPVQSRLIPAHVTLAHPRNPKAPGNEMTNAASLAGGLTISFGSVQLIEQADAAPWAVRRTFPLSAMGA